MFFLFKEYMQEIRLLFGFLALFWQLTTFPGSRPPSIIVVKELNFRVRDGNGWVLLAIVTGFSFLFFEVVPSKLNNVPL